MILSLEDIVGPFQDGTADEFISNKWGLDSKEYIYPDFRSDARVPEPYTGPEISTYFHDGDPTFASDVKVGWYDHKDFCEVQGQRLCSLEELCPIRTFQRDTWPDYFPALSSTNNQREQAVSRAKDNDWMQSKEAQNIANFPLSYIESGDMEKVWPLVSVAHDGRR